MAFLFNHLLLPYLPLQLNSQTVNASKAFSPASSSQRSGVSGTQDPQGFHIWRQRRPACLDLSVGVCFTIQIISQSEPRVQRPNSGPRVSSQRPLLYGRAPRAPAKERPPGLVRPHLSPLLEGLGTQWASWASACCDHSEVQTPFSQSARHSGSSTDASERAFKFRAPGSPLCLRGCCLGFRTNADGKEEL